MDDRQPPVPPRPMQNASTRFASDAFKDALDAAGARLTPAARRRWEAHGRPTTLAEQHVDPVKFPGLIRSRMGRLYTHVDGDPVRRYIPKPKGKAARRAEKLERRRARERQS